MKESEGWKWKWKWNGVEMKWCGNGCPKKYLDMVRMAREMHAHSPNIVSRPSVLPQLLSYSFVLFTIDSL